MTLLIFGFVLLITSIKSTLSVYNAQSLGFNTAELGIENINFSIANFGFVP